MTARAWLVVAALVAAPAPASAEDVDVSPQLWLGYRQLAGLADQSGPSAGLGVRAVRRAYAAEVAIANLQLDGRDGLHTAVRLSAGVSPLDATWLTAGVSYGWAHGYVDAPLPVREGHGFQLELGARRELLEHRNAKAFVQLSLTAPLYQARDIYGSDDDARWIAGGELALGVGF